MLYCLNPDCDQPHNPDGINFCQNCGVKTVSLLRNRYRIINIIGSGGFGRTLLAEDIDKLNERCVVKQLAPNVQGNWALNKAKQLFEQEARRLQQLGNHPQIPSLYSYFEEDGRLYLVQELIDGHNLLMELKQQGVFSERKIRALLDNVLDILQVVHQQNVIHRDIKPENIMRRNPQQGLNKGGDLVLIDFGVAKQATASVMSKPGTTIGSFGYSSIEQMQGGETYPASDLFSLGATCFHLLSNIHPHDLFINEGYSWVQNWRQHLQQPISANLTFVLDKLLEKDYQKRFQSAAEVKKDLHPQPQVSPPPTIPAVPPTIPVKPKPQQRVSPPPTIPVAPKPPLPKPKPWLKVSIVLLFGLGLWQFLPQMKNVISRPSSPAKTINYENLALATTLSGHSNWVHSVAFSPDGQSLASGSDDKTLKIWDVATGKVKSTLTGHSDRVYSVAFSPDGQSLASGSDDKTLKIWEVATGKVKSTLTGHSDRVNSVAFSLDGQSLASGSDDKTLKIWEVATGKVKSTLTGHSDRVNSVAFSLDGQNLASGGSESTLKIWDVATRKVKSTLTGHSSWVYSVAFSPDGQSLASGSWDKTIKIWDVATGNVKSTLIGHSTYVNSVAFSPDGQSLASGSGDNTLKIWDVATGNVKSTLTGHSSWVHSVAFSPDGQSLASGSYDKTIKIWRVPK